MRILKIELPATITSVDPDISLASDALREQLRRELDALKEELGESVRRRAVDYFPSDYTVFVRFFFWVDDNRAKVILWIDDPTVALAQRALRAKGLEAVNSHRRPHRQRNLRGAR